MFCCLHDIFYIFTYVCQNMGMFWHEHPYICNEKCLETYDNFGFVNFYKFIYHLRFSSLNFY